MDELLGNVFFPTLLLFRCSCRECAQAASVCTDPSEEEGVEKNQSVRLPVDVADRREASQWLKLILQPFALIS